MSWERKDREHFARWERVGEDIPRSKINIEIDFPGQEEKYLFCVKLLWSLTVGEKQAKDFTWETGPETAPLTRKGRRREFVFMFFSVRLPFLFLNLHPPIPPRPNAWLPSPHPPTPKCLALRPRSE